jgi:predicted TPR repeat methyltransferase
MNASLHDAYAADYDRQVGAYDCHVADLLFGLCYEYLQPGQTLLDLGIGSGLSALPFAKAGLKVYGMDFSTAMLEICRAKRIAAELKQHDLQQVPWPYPSDGFDHLVCCGVLHFIPDLGAVFDEAERVLRKGGVFAFTTKAPTPAENRAEKYDRQSVGGFEIYSHFQSYLDILLAQHSFQRLKLQRCFAGEDIFALWVVAGTREK